MFTKAQLRSAGFSIFPVGHKVCFQDCRNGYVSPSYDADTCMQMLMEYIGLHRAASGGTDHFEKRGDAVKPVIQDGADFYDDDTGEVIVSYPELVKNDSDLAGAEAARARFMTQFPDYEFIDPFN